MTAEEVRAQLDWSEKQAETKRLGEAYTQALAAMTEASNVLTKLYKERFAREARNLCSPWKDVTWAYVPTCEYKEGRFHAVIRLASLSGLASLSEDASYRLEWVLTVFEGKSRESYAGLALYLADAVYQVETKIQEVERIQHARSLAACGHPRACVVNGVCLWCADKAKE